MRSYILKELYYLYRHTKREDKCQLNNILNNEFKMHRNNHFNKIITFYTIANLI